MRFPWRIHHTLPAADPLLRALPEEERWQLTRHPHDLPDGWLQLMSARRQLR